MEKSLCFVDSSGNLRKMAGFDWGWRVLGVTENCGMYWFTLDRGPR